MSGNGGGREGEEVRAKARQAVKSASELLDAVERAAHARLSREVPRVVNALDSSFEQATKGLAEALSTIDKRTSKEQSELLRAYRSFLQKQTELIDRKMASMQTTRLQQQESKKEAQSD